MTRCALWFLILQILALVARADLSDAPVADAVAYSFELLPASAESGAVRIGLQVQGQSSGSSRFAMAPSWAGVQNCEHFVHDLHIRGADGNDLELITDPNAPHEWTVHHKPGEMLDVSYELRSSRPDPLSNMSTRYEPVVRPNFLHLIGETGLIYPEWLENRGPLDISLSSKGFTTFTSSFDTLKSPFRKTMQEFRHAIFLGGDVRIQDRDLQGTTLRVAIAGTDWGFSDSDFADLVARVVAAERDFTNDHSDPFFLVTAVGTGAHYNPQMRSLGGTGLTNCFALFLQPGTPISADSPMRNQVLLLLAHEYFHTWTGGRIGMEQPEELVYWFSEGFTDFYSSRLLLRAGLIDQAEWTSQLNASIKTLWLSPVATEPASTIQRDYWTRMDVQRLPYHRGQLVAIMIDEEIRRVSGGKKSLDDFFLEVLAAARTGELAETSRLLDRLSRWTCPAFAETIRRIIVDGAMPELPELVTSPASKRSTGTAYAFDPGFDVDTSIKTKVATGVREGSVAHAAGLRDGIPIEGFSVYFGDADKEIKLNIREGDERKSLKFFPRGKATEHPLYSAAPAAAN